MVSAVAENTPTAQEARAALAEATSQAALVRRADREFRWILLVIAAFYLAVAGIFSVAGRRGGLLPSLALVFIVLAALVGIIWLGLRLRAYSTAGMAWYVAAIAAFSIWNGIVAGASIASGFWATTQPTYHLGISVVVAVIPLIAAAYLIGRR